MAEIIIRPIGLYHSKIKNTYEAGRQADPHHGYGTIELYSQLQVEQSCLYLDSFSHIWIIFQFHQNTEWKPMTSPPRGDHKVGVFASRSPYRPNFIGMSAVRLISIEANRIQVFGADLIDQTPIIDIKPYLPYSDSIPDANSGWISSFEKFEIEFSELAKIQIDFLNKYSDLGIESFIWHQLEYEPTNDRKKRVRHLSENNYEISYRTWRIDFKVIKSILYIEKIRSGYTDLELNSAIDSYQDKKIHLEFIRFTNSLESLSTPFI